MSRFLLVAVFLGGCSTTWDPHAPRTITAPEAGGEVTVKHGQRLRVPVPAPEAGYDWLKREPVTVVVMAEGLVDAQGLQFTPVRSGKETLLLELRKPNEDAAKRTITYEVTVP